jgi:hypothetical protein
MGDGSRTRLTTERNDGQILAHVSLISASTIAVVSSVTSGALATYWC